VGTVMTSDIKSFKEIYKYKVNKIKSIFNYIVMYHWEKDRKSFNKVREAYLRYNSILYDT